VNWHRKTESSTSKATKLKLLRSVRLRIRTQTKQSTRQSRIKSTLSTSSNMYRIWKIKVKSKRPSISWKARWILHSYAKILGRLSDRSWKPKSWNINLSSSNGTKLPQSYLTTTKASNYQRLRRLLAASGSTWWSGHNSGQQTTGAASLHR
jgi:hypothetical protein